MVYFSIPQLPSEINTFCSGRMINTATMGLYLHIPFCHSKCLYCDFYSLKSGDLIEPYVEILHKQLTDMAKRYSGYTLESIYFGGGTPTAIGAGHLCGLLGQIKAVFPLLPDCEISLEANPNSIDYAGMAQLRTSGFNRISFGVQSAVDSELEQLGRTHSSKDAEQVIHWARNAGFENISMDLMMGIPGQTLDSLQQSLSFAAAQKVQHISAYLLKIEEGTPYYRMRHQLALPDDDRQSDFYLAGVEYLARMGYAQYEISNFALPGFPCRHNLVYWNCGEYLGLGPSAHSFLRGVRSYYPRNLLGYLGCQQPVSDGEGGSLAEYCMLRLRLAEGIIFTDAMRRGMTQEQAKAMRRGAESLAANQLCVTGQEKIALTPKGFLLSNLCTSYLLDLL